MRRDTILHFTKLVGSTFLFQTCIQILGMVVGFYIVRKLSVQEYAYYTVANTLLGMMSVLSDGGISSATNALGGKNWQSKESLGQVLTTAIKYRKTFSFISIAICLPFGIYLLNKQNISWEYSIIIFVCLLPSFYSQLTSGLYEIVPSLHQDIRPLQTNQVIVALFRLILSVLAVFIFPFTWAAILANGIPRILGNVRLKKIVEKRADLSQPINDTYTKEISRILKRSFPGAVYFAFSGQISLLILSYLGKVSNVASWGALGRYSVIFTIIGMVVNILLIPRYVRMENDKTKLLKMAHSILGLSIIFGIVILGFCYLFSNQLLWILGSNYMGLNKELLLILINGGILFLVGIVFSFSVRKGWIIHPIIEIGFNLLPLIIFINFFKFNSLESVLLFNILCSSVILFGHYVAFLYQVYKKASN